MESPCQDRRASERLVRRLRRRATASRRRRRRVARSRPASAAVAIHWAKGAGAREARGGWGRAGARAAGEARSAVRAAQGGRRRLHGESVVISVRGDAPIALPHVYPFLRPRVTPAHVSQFADQSLLFVPRYAPPADLQWLLQTCTRQATCVAPRAPGGVGGSAAAPAASPAAEPPPAVPARFPYGGGDVSRRYGEGGQALGSLEA